MGTVTCIAAVSGAVTTTFVYDAMGQLAAEYGGPPVTDPGTRYLFGDHLGSTRIVIKADANVDKTYDYLPFGEEIGGLYPASAAVRGTQRLEFTSKERDAETGLDYFGARYMSSAQGRFTSPDVPLIAQRPVIRKAGICTRTPETIRLTWSIQTATKTCRRRPIVTATKNASMPSTSPKLSS